MTTVEELREMVEGKRSRKRTATEAVKEVEDSMRGNEVSGGRSEIASQAESDRDERGECA